MQVGCDYWPVLLEKGTEIQANCARTMLRHPVSALFNATSRVCFTLLVKLQMMDCLPHRVGAQGWTVSRSKDVKSVWWTRSKLFRNDVSATIPARLVRKMTERPKAIGPRTNGSAWLQTRPSVQCCCREPKGLSLAPGMSKPSRRSIKNGWEPELRGQSRLPGKNILRKG